MTSCGNSTWREGLPLRRSRIVRTEGSGEVGMNCQNGARPRHAPHGRSVFPFFSIPRQSLGSTLSEARSPQWIAAPDLVGRATRQKPSGRLPAGDSPAQLLAPMCDRRGLSDQSMRDCRRNGVHQKKTHFASRLKRITPVQPCCKRYFSFGFSESPKVLLKRCRFEIISKATSVRAHLSGESPVCTEYPTDRG
jgi:hypothetical protein